MRTVSLTRRRALSGVVLASLVLSAGVTPSWGQGVVPGTGTRLAIEDFEDQDWSFNVSWPKSSYNLDRQVREPTGKSSNGIFYESRKRGIPEVMKRVDPPEGGIPGSTGALLMRSLYTGIPGRPSFKTQQDDALMNLKPQLGGTIPVSWSPSVIARVYLPPFEKWEPKTGATFGMRVSVTGVGPDELEEGEKPKPKYKRVGLFRRRRVDRTKQRVRDNFYPSFFIQFNSRRDGAEKDSAVFIIRGNDNNQDYAAKEITRTGWWTLGISFSPDGKAHYYASPGVDDLTRADHVASHFPQSVRVEYLKSFYFNVCSQDTGKHWSTPWIVDDPAVYARSNYRSARR